MIEHDEALFAQQQVVRLQALLEASRRIHSTIGAGRGAENSPRGHGGGELELTGGYFTDFRYSYGDVSANLLKYGAAPGSASDVVESPPDRAMRFPLHDKAGIPFTELVVIPQEGRVLTLDELDFLESLAIQSAVAIENARFHEQIPCAGNRLESDLASARQVQRSLLPQTMPHIPRIYPRHPLGCLPCRGRRLPSTSCRCHPAR